MSRYEISVFIVLALLFVVVFAAQADGGSCLRCWQPTPKVKMVEALPVEIGYPPPVTPQVTQYPPPLPPLKKATPTGVLVNPTPTPLG